MNHKKIKPLEVTLTGKNNQRDLTETIGRRQHMAPSPKTGRNLKEIEPSSQDIPGPTPSMELFPKTREKPHLWADKQTRERRRHLPRIFLRFLKQGFFPEVFRRRERKIAICSTGILFLRFFFWTGFFLRFLTRTRKGNITKCQQEAQDDSKWTFPQVFEYGFFLRFLNKNKSAWECQPRARNSKQAPKSARGWQRERRRLKESQKSRIKSGP